MPKGWNENRVIALPEAKELGKKFGYVFPAKDEAIITKAQTYHGQLSLEIKVKERKYEITQFPGPRNWLMDNIPKHLIVKTRKFKDYSVLEFHNPGLKKTVLIYLKPDAALMVDAKPLEFDDAVLDNLVASFEKCEPGEAKK